MTASSSTSDLDVAPARAATPARAGLQGDAVLRLDGASLCYRLAKQKVASIKEYAIHWMRGALVHEELWALRDVDLRVSAGERVGIVGRNGAGKSTLLKVVCGVLKPTRGSVLTSGRIAPILELGTGFDYELTGYENVYLNALLLGRSRREIDEQVDSIVDFSGLGDFIRSPIRNYSSGMLARLGFSIATAWVPEILILDEVLAVGDARFVRRCQDKIAEMRSRGSAILLVSHNLDEVEAQCERVVWMEDGRVAGDGPASQVLERYRGFADAG